ncbi:hypothetical protein GCM10023148_53050 [Actinokineospora soli]
MVVLSTGTELTPPGEPLAPGRIYESNSVLVAAAVREVGGEATVLRFVPDDVDAFLATVADLSDADLLITSGGVSAGAYEVVKDALTGRGVEFVRVAMQPGGPQGSGLLAGGPAVVALPGNPVSAALSFELFVRPALLGAMAHAVVDLPHARARTTAPLRSPVEKVQYRRGRHDEGVVEVVPVGGPGSHLLASFAESNCLIVLPVGVGEVVEGDEVELILLD